MDADRLLLIVEDDDAFARTLTRSFERRGGYRVLRAASLEQLQALLAQTHPDAATRLLIQDWLIAVDDLAGLERRVQARLARQPEAVDHLGAGRLALERKQFDVALRHFQQARELAPEADTRARAWRGLAGVAYQQRDYALSLRQLEAARDQAPSAAERPDLLMAFNETLIRLGRTNEAVSAAEEAVRQTAETRVEEARARLAVIGGAPLQQPVRLPPQALGFGFRCGFLGLLHMEIVQERLEREFDQDLITTAPSVVYQVELNGGEILEVENPSKMPEVAKIKEIREPIVTVHLYMPQDYVGPVMTLANLKRGVQLNMAYHGRQVMLTYEMPLAEIVLDFFDKLKSVSRGYASMDYEFKEYRASDVVKVDLMINGDRVDALSIIVHRAQSAYRGRAVAAKMREQIPRQMYDVAIQAAIGGNIIARENIKALRKNVLAKCYGGDITRKKKLLEKQKAGKKRMKQVGSVEVPQEAFLAILQVDD